jgi:hypothetical protein
MATGIAIAYHGTSTVSPNQLTSQEHSEIDKQKTAGKIQIFFISPPPSGLIIA